VETAKLYCRQLQESFTKTSIERERRIKTRILKARNRLSGGTQTFAHIQGNSRRRAGSARFP
jgi:hypothetical protein